MEIEQFHKDSVKKPSPKREMEHEQVFHTDAAKSWAEMTAPKDWELVPLTGDYDGI